MKIKDLIKLQKLLIEFGQNISFNDVLIRQLVFVISSVKQELDKKHEQVIKNRWERKPR